MKDHTQMTHPFRIEGAARPSRWLITCDHATNRVPLCINDGDLGLPNSDMERHIAYDVGALGLAKALGQYLNGPMILADFSRLVIDPNRGEHDPTLLMRLYDGSIIPANRTADAAEVERRLDAFHRPYHNALADLAARHADCVLLSVHSFAPQLKGREPRPWHVGVLYAEDDRLARPLIARLEAEVDICVGDNEPYSGHLPGDTMDRHAVDHDRPHVLIELRNDLIERPEDQEAWAARLAPILEGALTDMAAVEG